MSTFVNKVDRKGRVSVPATFRSQIQLPGHVFLGVVAYPMRGQEALEGTTMDRMVAMAAAVEQIADEQTRHDLKTFIFGQSQQLGFDPEGRILLPEQFLAHTHIADSATFVGTGETFQIWEPARYAAHRVAVSERIERNGTQLPPVAGPGTRAGS